MGGSGVCRTSSTRVIAAAEGAYLVGDTAVFSTSFHVIREYTSLTRNLEAKAAQSAGQMARYKDKRKLVGGRVV